MVVFFFSFWTYIDMISNTVITYGWKQYCYVSKTCTILDNPLVIESSRAPFFICIWGLKRLTNSCFSIQLTVWSRGDEVKGTKKEKRKSAWLNFLLDFLLNPTTLRISMSGRAARLHRRLFLRGAQTRARTHTHKCALTSMQMVMEDVRALSWCCHLVIDQSAHQ